MFLANTLLLLSVTSPPLAATAGVPAASTYDEAACAASAEAQAADSLGARDDRVNCSEAPPQAAVPAVIDCNDPTLDRWVGEMIGSCDMPHPAPPFGPQIALTHAHEGGLRL